MADTSYMVNDPLTVKLWSKMLNTEVLKACFMAQFMGPAQTDIIQVKDETQKSAGDKITYGLRMQLNGAGVLGDGTLEGQEESLVTYSDSLVINQLRHAVRSGGRMSQQRVTFDIRKEALDGLSDWFADRIDTSAFNQLAGYTVNADVRYTGLQAVTAPDSNHVVRPTDANNAGTDESVSTTGVFTISMIDKAVERARTLTPAFRPLQIGNKKMYAAFIHEYQVTDLRINTNTGQWLDIQKAAMQGGEISDNPIFDGSLGVYNNVVLHATTRVPYGVHSTTGLDVTGVRRAILCGAQAGVVGYGRENGPTRYTWVEETFDYGNKLGVSAGSIFGLKKSVFNSADYATVVISTYAVAH